MVKILIACEESQAVCKAFRLEGFEAYSCDIEPCSGGHPEWHLQQDVAKLLKEEWSAVIAFPPCTHLCVSGAKHFAVKRADGRQQQGIDFFMLFANLKIPYAIENPVGIMSSVWRKPDQVIQPWQFGDCAQKTTCLWLNGLPKIVPTKIVEKGSFYISPSGKKLPSWYGDAVDANGKKIGYNTQAIKTLRSKTFPGIAEAMAKQWGASLRHSLHSKQQMQPETEASGGA